MLLKFIMYYSALCVV